MNKSRVLLSRCSAALFSFLLVVSAASAAPSEVYVPEGLKDWVPWVHEKHRRISCAVLGNERTCVWPGKLSLSLDAKGGEFRFRANMGRAGMLMLPGGNEIWPLEVQLVGGEGDSQAVRVIAKGNRPVAVMKKGEHTLVGKLRWDSLPEAIFVPASVGLIDLRISGKKIELSSLGKNGGLWLRSKLRDEQVEKESLKVLVHRRFFDGMPFRMNSRFELRISGKAREIRLGRVLPEGAQPVSIASPLSYRLNSDYSITLQGKPGIHTLGVESVFAAPPEKLSPLKNSLRGWPREEIWVWLANEQLRSVELEGSSPIDPQRTSLPDDWKGHPTYALSPETTLVFKETRRGQRSLAPNRVDIARTLWLDLDGAGYTVKDSISGVMSQGWRLNALGSLDLGRVSVNGEDQLITTDAANDLSGVELRSSEISLAAESRIKKGGGSFKAVGWDHDVNSLRAKLVLPPGWTLLHASGVDAPNGSWLYSWSLLDIFVAVLISAATLKLFGALWGILVLILLVISHGEAGAPHFIWFGLLAGAALLHVLPQGVFRKCVQVYYYIALFFLAVIGIPFALLQIQTGLFPQLGTPAYIEGLSILGPVIWFSIISLLILAVCASVGAFLYLLYKRLWGWALTCFVLCAITVTIAVTVIGLFSQFGTSRKTHFNEPYADYATGAVEEEAVELQVSKAPAPQRKSKMQTLNRMQNFSEASFDDALVGQLQMNDPKAVVQTGPGVPSWNWGSGFKRQSAPRRGGDIHLNWSGPVEKTRDVGLMLLSPGWNLLLSILRVIALFALAGVYFRFGRKLGSQMLLCLLLSLVAFSPRAVWAETFPSEALLKELDGRLNRNLCHSYCTTAESLEIKVAYRSLSLEARVSSDGAGAWPIPGPLDQFYPDKVLVDGEETTALRRGDKGTLWVRIPDGVHTVQVSGMLAKATTLTLQFTIPPRYVRIDAPDWEIDGLGPRGNVGNSLQLIQKTPAVKTKRGVEETETRVPPWYKVRRELVIAVPWSVHTTVKRLRKTKRSEITKLPLLKGEAVTSETLEVEDGYALLRFPRGQSQLSWLSSLSEVPEFSLKAGSGGRYTEEWVLRCSSIFRCETSGIAPIRSSFEGQNSMMWLPWPEDEVTVKVRKPQAVEGQSVTIDRVFLTYTPGLRLLNGLLALDARTSQGGWQKLTMPEGAEVFEVRLNGKAQAIRPKGRELALPLSPGTQRYHVDWRQPFENGLRSQMPQVALGSPAVNAEIKVHVPEKRWVLWARGPKWGPVFLYWGELLLIVLVALCLGRRKVASLSTASWVLLGLGLSTVPIVAMFIPPLWLVALRYRRDRPAKNYIVFNLVQIGLVLLTIAALGVLYAAVSGGLVGSPDMNISGFGSTNNLLKWYVDRIDSLVPAPVVLSVPIWVWRGLMLLWSSWLVWALLGWLRGAWGSVSDQGLWRKKG